MKIDDVFSVQVLDKNGKIKDRLKRLHDKLHWQKKALNARIFEIGIESIEKNIRAEK